MRHAQRSLCILVAGLALAAMGILTLRGSPTGEFWPPKKAPPLQWGGVRERQELLGGMRIVSLSPSVTEMLFVLDVGESIVGVTDYCNYPPEAKRIECVGGFGRPNVEKLLALAPDLVVASGFERTDIARELRKSGIQVVDVTIRNVDEMFQELRHVGDAVGKRPRADQIVASMQAELKRIASRSGNPRHGPLPRVFIELWDDPLTTAGGGSFLDDLVSRAGGVNVAHDLAQPHPRISPEKVLEWNPDVLVIAHMSRGAGSAAQIAERIGWSDLAAVKNGKVFCDIPTDLLLRPGPRLIDGVKALAQRLRGVVPESKPAANEVN